MIDIGIVKNEKIKTNSLDNIKLPDKDFIKIDIQGGELNVINIASKTLQDSKDLK